MKCPPFECIVAKNVDSPVSAGKKAYEVEILTGYPFHYPVYGVIRLACLVSVLRVR
jgi:hypothetical protein